MAISDNKLVRDGLQGLRRRLPPGWSVAGAGGGTAVEVTAPDRRTGELTLETRARLAPKDVRALVEKLEADPTPVVVAPFLTESTRARLRESDVGYLDLTGNTRIVLPEPGLFIETQGAAEDRLDEGERGHVATMSELDELYVIARRVLLDALDALGDHRDAIVLVGAQAVYPASATPTSPLHLTRPTGTS